MTCHKNKTHRRLNKSSRISTAYAWIPQVSCSTRRVRQRHFLFGLGLAGVYGRSIGVSGFFEVLLHLSVESVFVETFATGTATASCGVAVATPARTIRSWEKGGYLRSGERGRTDKLSTRGLGWRRQRDLNWLGSWKLFERGIAHSNSRKYPHHQRQPFNKK